MGLLFYFTVKVTEVLESLNGGDPLQIVPFQQDLTKKKKNKSKKLTYK